MKTAYVILTSRVGEFRTEPAEGLEPVEAWDYSFAGRKRARFVIARVDGAGRVRIVDETPPPAVNFVRTKFLEEFATVEAARRQLQELAGAGGREFKLEPVG